MTKFLCLVCQVHECRDDYSEYCQNCIDAATLENAGYLAARLIGPYVERGDSLESIRQGLVGYGDDVNRMEVRLSPDVVLVTRQNGRSCNVAVPLAKLYEQCQA